MNVAAVTPARMVHATEFRDRRHSCQRWSYPAVSSGTSCQLSSPSQRDRQFESISLQRRIRKLSVPLGVEIQSRGQFKALKPGNKAVFTHLLLPFKCPGASQKIVYLTADYLQRGGIRTNVDLKYFVHAPVIFGVPFFARECAKVASR